MRFLDVLFGGSAVLFLSHDRGKVLTTIPSHGCLDFLHPAYGISDRERGGCD